MLVEVV